MTKEQWLGMSGTHYAPEPNTGCWLWFREINQGYGRVKSGGRRWLAHRLSYTLLRGPIPDGLTLDHLCRVRCCVNPDHLEPVPIRENLMRSPIAPAAVNARKTHCIRGHAFDETNTYTFPAPRSTRYCRTCYREIDRARARKRREEARRSEVVRA